jgi:Immunoglobulin I-set domain
MVKFEVKVVGHPKPEVKWLKAGEEILPSDEFQIENLEDGTHILIINDVYPDDTGEIKFEAFNSVGVAETITEFVVEGSTFNFSLVFFLSSLNDFPAFTAILRKRFAAIYLYPTHTFFVQTLFFIRCFLFQALFSNYENLSLTL